MLTKTTAIAHTPRILLFEEHPLFQKMTQTMLEILGITCLSATRQDEALEIFQQGCDLVLLNVDLKNPSSFELAKQMRAIDALLNKHTPIIGNTSEVDLEQIEALSLEAKIDCTYFKINNLQELYFILSEWLACPLNVSNNLFNLAA